MGPFPFSTLDTSAAALEFQMPAEGVTATYGMPTFQFYNVYGTLAAQTPATTVDTENGLWAKGWTHCLAGLPTGTYTVEMWNATADGVGQRINASYVYLYGSWSRNYIDDHRYFVAQQHRDFLGHEPNQAGLDTLTGQITQCDNVSYRQQNETYAQCVMRKRVDVSRTFWYSNEFLQYHSGLRNPPGTTPDFNNREFVRLCYAVYSQRQPNQDEWDHWSTQLDATGDYNSVIKIFINDDDYRARFEMPPPDINPDPPGDPCQPMYQEPDNPLMEEQPCY